MSTSPGDLAPASPGSDRFLTVCRLVISAALLALAWDTRAAAPELAGGIVALVGAHWLPAALQGLRPPSGGS